MTQKIENAADMIAFGEIQGQGLKPGAVLALMGDLGAGKTHFCKGIVKGLGGNDEVTSPTFSLVNEYRSGRLPIFHFDFYRLDSIEELQQIGWEEYWDEPGILLIEWADKFPEALPESAIWYQFQVNPDGSRTLITRS